MRKLVVNVGLVVLGGFAGLGLITAIALTQATEPVPLYFLAIYVAAFGIGAGVVALLASIANRTYA